MCILNDRESIIPVNSMLTTSINCIFTFNQWLNMFLKSEKELFPQYYSQNQNFCTKFSDNTLRYILCDNSVPLVETLLYVFNGQSLSSYLNDCFSISFNASSSLKSDFDELNFAEINETILTNHHQVMQNLIIHTCTNQFMNTQIKKLCEYYCDSISNNSANNSYNFGMYAFSMIANSQSLIELEQAIYSLMCILYSKTINSLVNRAFIYLKDRVKYYETLAKNINDKSSLTHFYFYHNSSTKNGVPERLKVYEKNKIQGGEEEGSIKIEKNLGLAALKREEICSSNSELDLAQFEDSKLDKINKSSLFYKMCEKIFEKCKLNIELCEKSDLEKGNTPSMNPKHSPKLLFYFVHQCSATLPLWTRLMVPLSNNNKLPISSCLHQKRFDKLFSNNTSVNKESVDVLIKRIYEENRILLAENVKIYGMNESEFDSKSLLDEKQHETELLKLKNIHQNSSDLPAQITLVSNKNPNIMLSGVPVKKLKKMKNTKKQLLNQNVFNVIPTNIQLNNHTVFNLINLSESNYAFSENNLQTLNHEYNFCDKNSETKKIRLNEENENEREIIIERQQQILTNKYGFELVKEDLDTLESPNKPNSNVVTN